MIDELLLRGRSLASPAVPPSRPPELSARAILPFLLGDCLPVRQFVSTKRIVAVMEELGYEPGTTRVALSRSYHLHRLERRRQGREASCRLQEWAWDTLASMHARVIDFGRGQPWDGTWTIVNFSMPDSLRTVRTSVTRRLLLMGFGHLRGTTWCVPRDCRDELKDLFGTFDVHDFLNVFSGSPCLLDVGDLIEQCWDLPFLVAGYRDFVQTYRRLPRRITDITALHLWIMINHDYRNLISHDPELPDELIPRQPLKARNECVALFHELDDRLTTRTSRFVMSRFDLL